MPIRAMTSVDPMFSGIAKAIYGDVDPREVLAKFSPGGSDLHVEGAMTPKQAKKQQRLAHAGLAAGTIAGVAGADAMRTSLKENRHRVAALKAGEDIGPVATKLSRYVKPRTAAGIVGGSLLGLHAVELGADALGMHAQTKQLRQANAAGAGKKPVAKAFRLKPLNVIPDQVPSLRAKRPRRTPLTTKAALYQPIQKDVRGRLHEVKRGVGQVARNVRDTTGHAEKASRTAAEAAVKAKKLIPSPRMAALAGAGGLVGLGATSAAGTLLGTYAGSRRAQKKAVAKGVQGAVRGVRQTVKNVKDTTSHAEQASRTAAEAAGKVKRLIPVPRTAALIGAGGLAGMGVTSAAGSYAGSYAGARRAQKKAARPVKKSVDDVTWTGVFSKVDQDKRQVFGWASVSKINGEDVVDLQGDIVPIEEVEKSAYRYVIESRKGGDMHRRVSKLTDDEPLHTADMIESFVVTPEKLEKMGLPENALPHGWWVGYHVKDDKQWAMVKSGERAGFSIHGSGTRTKVTKAYTPGSALEIVNPARKARLTPVQRVLRSEFDKTTHHARTRGDNPLVRPGQMIRGADPAEVGTARRLMEAHDANIRDAVKAGHAPNEIYHAINGELPPKRARALRGRTGREDLRRALGPKTGPIRGDRDWTPPPAYPDQPAVRRTFVGKADDGQDNAPRRPRLRLRERLSQAAHPPAVELKDVKSTAVKAMGYQPQARRLAVLMHSRPEMAYEYRMTRDAAKEALDAPSLGHHFATQVRGKAKRAERYTPADRARLFVDPQEN